MSFAPEYLAGSAIRRAAHVSLRFSARLLLTEAAVLHIAEYCVRDFHRAIKRDREKESALHLQLGERPAPKCCIQFLYPVIANTRLIMRRV